LRSISLAIDLMPVAVVVMTALPETPVMPVFVRQKSARSRCGLRNRRGGKGGSFNFLSPGCGKRRGQANCRQSEKHFLHLVFHF
jgi:hypothetical protein